MKNLNLIFLSLLLFAGLMACGQKPSEDNSALSLVSCNVQDGGESDESGRIEFLFSKPVRLSSRDAVITFNGLPVALSDLLITGEKVSFPYSGKPGQPCEVYVEAGAFMDMDGQSFGEEIKISFTISTGIGGIAAKFFDAVVDINGKGDYTSVQAAINAAPDNSTVPYLIFVANGLYHECLNVTDKKKFIHLIGQDVDNVRIQFELSRAKNSNEASYDYSCHNPESPARKAGYTSSQEGVVIVNADDFYAENISFINLFGALGSRYQGGLGRDGQAEALMTRQTRFAISNCKVVSFQDSWWLRPWNGVRQTAYVSDCLIEGRTDYVWGSGDLLVENSTFYNSGNGAFITAVGDNGKFVMRDCLVDGLAGATPFSFGRPYRSGMTNVWINTTLKMDIIPTHWSPWGAVPSLYGEYNTIGTDGKMISTESYTVGTGDNQYRTKVLTAQEAEEYTYGKMIKSAGWDPRMFMTDLDNPDVSINGNTLSWNAVEGAYGYVILKDGSYLGNTTGLSVEISSSNAVYTVKSVNRYGGISE